MNLLNQYTERTVPGVVDIIGEATENKLVLVNGEPADRQGQHFHLQLEVDNAAAPVYPEITAIVGQKGTPPAPDVYLAETNGNRFVAKTPEQFMYDADGNLPALRSLGEGGTTDGRWTNVWDGENRLLSMETLASVVSAGIPRERLEFAYDSQCRRVRKTALSGFTNGTFSITNTTAYLYDGNGNVMALVDAADKSIVATYEYDPFGNTLRATGAKAAANPFRFSTKYTDDETGLVYYGFRYYAPSVGRWASMDPAQETGGLDSYAMVFNNPVSSYDILGLVCCCKAIKAAFHPGGGSLFHLGRVEPPPGYPSSLMRIGSDVFISADTEGDPSQCRCTLREAGHSEYKHIWSPHLPIRPSQLQLYDETRDPSPCAGETDYVGMYFTQAQLKQFPGLHSLTYDILQVFTCRSSDGSTISSTFNLNDMVLFNVSVSP